MNLELLQKYAEVIRPFTEGRISEAEFERRYLDTFNAETTPMVWAEFQILDDLFGAVEAYCPEPSWRDEYDTDEVQLRAAAELALRRIEEAEAAIPAHPESAPAGLPAGTDRPREEIA